MTNDTEYTFSDEPPRDENGYPIHPERGHHICGATKSDKTTPTEHGRERDEYEYCLLAAGWGTDRSEGPCKKHPVKGEQWGQSNPNYKHGAFSNNIRKDLTDDEREAVNDLVDALEDPEQTTGIYAELIGDAYAKWDRTGDPRYIREIRQLLKEKREHESEIAERESPGEGVQRHEHVHVHQDSETPALSEDEMAAFDAITDGPAEIEVEAVEETESEQEADAQ